MISMYEQNWKPVAAGSATRYRLQINDGQKQTASSMLGTQCNPLIESGEMNKFSLVKLNRTVVNQSKNAKVMSTRALQRTSCISRVTRAVYNRALSLYFVG